MELSPPTSRSAILPTLIMGVFTVIAIIACLLALASAIAGDSKKGKDHETTSQQHTQTETAKISKSTQTGEPSPGTASQTTHNQQDISSSTEDMSGGCNHA